MRGTAWTCALVLALGGQTAPAAGWEARLDAELAEVRAAVARYRDHSVAEAEGWRVFGANGPAMGEHWRHKERRPQLPGEPLNLSRPLNLMYSEIGGKRELTGVTYGYRLGPGEPLPQGFAGPLDRWHVHDFARILEVATAERAVAGWIARRWLNRRFAPDGRTRLAMVHVWLDGNPDGPFAERNRTLPYRRAGLGERYWQDASLVAAYGLALTHPDGCRNELRGRLRIARVGREVQQQIYAACARAAAAIRGALDAEPARLNATAAQVWSAYDRTRRSLLTPEQRARIAALVEHGPDHSGTAADHGSDPSHVR